MPGEVDWTQPGLGFDGMGAGRGGEGTGPLGRESPRPPSGSGRSVRLLLQGTWWQCGRSGRLLSTSCTQVLCAGTLISPIFTHVCGRGIPLF